MRFMLATEEASMPLTLARSQGAESGAKLVDLAAIFRPIAGALRRDRPVILTLGLPQQLTDRG